MTILVLTIFLFLGAMSAGLVGSLTGLGGGVILIPLLTIVFKVDIHYAIGTSLVSVIATSSGAAAAYVKEGISNIRIGMFLEVATTTGAIMGAYIAIYTQPYIIAVIFGAVLIFAAISSFAKKEQAQLPATSTRLAYWLRLNGTYPSLTGIKSYQVINVAGGFFMMMAAGIISGLLGIGSGALKVIAMDNIMRIPFKVSTATSNFMIGVTAAASAGLYLQRGYIDPGLSFPVVLGVLLGAIAGSRILVKSKTRVLRLVFGVVITLLAAEMIYNGLTHQI
ncbi:MAG TPA: sulfite exporter TauE/SafE family protein [Chitinophagaceae bacterium]|jgi:uncharacterized membrane protein YfcA|nr:sulfite exporter TauE/SafE family protein [Chitinophagaceae bacterium]